MGKWEHYFVLVHSGPCNNGPEQDRLQSVAGHQTNWSNRGLNQITFVLVYILNETFICTMNTQHRNLNCNCYCIHCILYSLSFIYKYFAVFILCRLFFLHLWVTVTLHHNAAAILRILAIHEAKFQWTYLLKTPDKISRLSDFCRGSSFRVCYTPPPLDQILTTLKQLCKVPRGTY